MAIREADTAVRVAEQPQADEELGAYRVYLADGKVEIARAEAETSLAEDQRVVLSVQRESARLDARTREADAARGQVATARAEGAEQRVAADQARSEADVAQLDAANSQQQAVELQRQIDVLQATRTDRGLLLTLGDVRSRAGEPICRSGAASNLNKLVAFLNEYPDRTVAIEGYTDSLEDYNNPGLSARRADSVRSYLAGQGIDSDGSLHRAWARATQWQATIPLADGSRIVASR